MKMCIIMTPYLFWIVTIFSGVAFLIKTVSFKCEYPYEYIKQDDKL